MIRDFLILSAVGALVTLVVRIGLPRVLAWRGVSFWWHTKFGPTLVFDSTDADGTVVRLLNVSGTYQSVCYVDPELRWDPVCEYHRTWARQVDKTFGLPREEQAQPRRRALVLGGGGYSFPKWVVAYRPDFVCTAVEIDPAITDIARDLFFVDQLEEEAGDRLELVNDEAWGYLAADTAGYDLIVNDVFSGKRPMGALGTEEGARLVRGHLRPGGLYIGNVRTPLEGRGSELLAETTSAFEQVFSRVEVVPERPEDPTAKGNNSLFAWV